MNRELMYRISALYCNAKMIEFRIRNLTTQVPEINVIHHTIN